MVGELVQAGVRHHQDVVTKLLADGPQSAVEHAIFSDSGAAAGILVLFLRHAEQIHRAYSRFQGFLDCVQQGLLGVLHHARQA